MRTAWLYILLINNFRISKRLFLLIGSLLILGISILPAIGMTAVSEKSAVNFALMATFVVPFVLGGAFIAYDEITTDSYYVWPKDNIKSNYYVEYDWAEDYEEGAVERIVVPIKIRPVKNAPDKWSNHYFWRHIFFSYIGRNFDARLKEVSQVGDEASFEQQREIVYTSIIGACMPVSFALLRGGVLAAGTTLDCVKSITEKLQSDEIKTDLLMSLQSYFEMSNPEDGNKNLMVFKLNGFSDSSSGVMEVLGVESFRVIAKDDFYTLERHPDKPQ